MSERTLILLRHARPATVRCRCVGGRRSRRTWRRACRARRGSGARPRRSGCLVRPARRPRAGDHVVHQPLDLAEVGDLGQREVHRDAPRRPRRPASRPSGSASRRSRAVKPWRSIEVIRSSTTRGPSAGPPSASAARSSSRPTVWITRSGSVARRPRPARERPPRRQHQQRAVEALGHLGELLVGADRDGVDAEPRGLAGEPGQAEAVAVALEHGHETGVPLVHRAQVASASGRRRRRGSGPWLSPGATCRGRRRW